MTPRELQSDLAAQKAEAESPGLEGLAAKLLWGFQVFQSEALQRRPALGKCRVRT